MILVFSIVCFLLLFRAKVSGTYAPECATKRSVTDAIKGLFIIFVFFRHASQYVLEAGGSFSLQGDWIYFRLDSILEQLIVAMFLFYSGFGVVRARLMKGPDYARLLPRNRIAPVFLNFAFAVTVFLCAGIMLGESYSLKKIVLSFIGWDSVGNSNWYIFDILLCYLATYISFVLFPPEKKKCRCVLCLIALIFTIELFLSQIKEPHWYNTILCYAIGAYYAFSFDGINKILRCHFVAVFVCAALACCFSRFLDVELFGLLDNICAIAFAILVLCVTSVIEPSSVALRWLGERLFPLYIYQRLPMLVFAALFPVFVAKHYMIFFLVCGIITMIVACVYHYVKIDAEFISRVIVRARNFAKYAKDYGIVSGIAHEFDRGYVPNNVAMWHRILNKPDFSVISEVNCVDVVLTFSMGGGASDYVSQKLKKQPATIQTFIIKEIHAKGVLSVEVWHRGKVFRRFYINKLSDLKGIKEESPRKVIRIVINELVLWNYYKGSRVMSNGVLEEIIDEIISLKNTLNANILYLVHDYFSICPRITLLTPDFKFCNASQERPDCRACVKMDSVLPLAFDHGVNVHAWRTAMTRLIDASEEVRTFSRDSHDRMKMFFPNAKLNILPHELCCVFERKPKLNSRKITIGVFGEVSRTKGADQVLELADYLLKEGLRDVRIVVVGVISLPVGKYSNVMSLGRYKRENLPDIIESAGINIALFPSVWPETFSYVVQEIMALELPIVCFDLGAPAGRVVQYEKGAIIPNMNPESTWKTICDLFKNCYG